MDAQDRNERICRVDLLGPPRVTRLDQEVTRFGSRKALALLAYLALRLGPHPRELLIDLLWRDMDLSAGRNNLSTTLVSLRRQLEPPGVRRGSVLIATHANIGLNPGAVTTDVAEFERLLDEAASLESPAHRAEALRRACALYRGDLAPGHYEDWVVHVQERLRARAQEALSQLAREEEALGDPDAALRILRRAVAVDPYSEDLHCHLVRLCVRTGRRSLGREANRRFEKLYADEFGGPPAEDTRRELARILAGAAPSPPIETEPPSEKPADASRRSERRDPPPAAGPARNTVLPFALGRFFGREDETAYLGRLLLPLKSALLGPDAAERRCRLATLTGMGGIGKTRLATEFARQAAEQLGMWCGFVSLADARDTNQVEALIASSLRLAPDPSVPPIEQAIAFLSERDRPGPPPLLVLDNLEQLSAVEENDQDRMAAIILTLLERVPGLIILCTSRRRLGIRGEQTVPLAPLPVPETPDHWNSSEALSLLLAVPSVRLYVDRAQAVRPDFGLTPTNAPAVAALCRQLDGSPLALELAAAWIRNLPPRKMWERLSQGLDIPSGGYSDLPARHRTLSAALEWSFRLLRPAEQRLFARLSVFRGGWTERAAAGVCEEPDALRILAELQDASLVTATEDDEGQARYGFLETVRAFGQTRLDASGEHGAALKRHADYHLALAEEAEPELRGPEQAAWLSRLEAEHDNLRAALDLLVSEEDGNVEGALRLSGALARFWNVHGHWAEARQRLEAVRALAGSSGSAVARAKVLNGCASFAHLLGDLRQAQALHEECLAIRRGLGDPARIANSLHNVGFMLLKQGNVEPARSYYEQSLEIARVLDDRIAIADELHHLGMVAHELGDVQRARAMYEESLSVRRPLGDARGIAYSLQNLANAACALGDYGRARELNEECLVIRRELGDRVGVAETLGNLGTMAFNLGELEEAGVLGRDALRIQSELGDRRGIADTLERLAALDAKTGRTDRAARLYAVADALREATGARRSPVTEQAKGQGLDDTSGDRSATTIGGPPATDRSWTWEQAVAEILAEQQR